MSCQIEERDVLRLVQSPLTQMGIVQEDIDRFVRLVMADIEDTADACRDQTIDPNEAEMFVCRTFEYLLNVEMDQS